MEPDKPYHIPWIEMSDELQRSLDYEGKLASVFQNRKWIELINDLILEGAFQPDFLANFASLSRWHR
jgi:hypothetical protein